MTCPRWVIYPRLCPQKLCVARRQRLTRLLTYARDNKYVPVKRSSWSLVPHFVPHTKPPLQVLVRYPYLAAGYRNGDHSETQVCIGHYQCDDSPDNVKFPHDSWHSSAALGMLNVTHIMPVLVLNTCMDANMQFTINSFRQLFADKVFSLTFPWQLSNSLTFPVFPDKWSPCIVMAV